MTVEGDLEALAQDALASVFRDDSGWSSFGTSNACCRAPTGGSEPHIRRRQRWDNRRRRRASAGRRSGSSAAALLEPLLAALEKGEAAAARDPVIQSLGYLVDASRDQLPDDFVELWDSTRKLLGL